MRPLRCACTASVKSHVAMLLLTSLWVLDAPPPAKADDHISQYCCVAHMVLHFQTPSNETLDMQQTWSKS